MNNTARPAEGSRDERIAAQYAALIPVLEAEGEQFLRVDGTALPDTLMSRIAQAIEQLYVSQS